MAGTGAPPPSQNMYADDEAFEQAVQDSLRLLGPVVYPVVPDDVEMYKAVVCQIGETPYLLIPGLGKFRFAYRHVKKRAILSLGGIVECRLKRPVEGRPEQKAVSVKVMNRKKLSELVKQAATRGENDTQAAANVMNPPVPQGTNVIPHRNPQPPAGAGRGPGYDVPALLTSVAAAAVHEPLLPVEPNALPRGPSSSPPPPALPESIPPNPFTSMWTKWDVASLSFPDGASATSSAVLAPAPDDADVDEETLLWECEKRISEIKSEYEARLRVREKARAAAATRPEDPPPWAAGTPALPPDTTPAPAPDAFSGISSGTGGKDIPPPT